MNRFARWLPSLPFGCALLLTGCQRGPLLIYPSGFREFAYVANGGANTVTALDLVFLRVDRTLAVGTAPVALAVNPARNEVYAVNSGSNSVSVIDTADNHVRATIAVEREPVAIAVDATGQRAFVLNAGSGSGSVSVLDLEREHTVGTVATGRRPTGLALAPDGRSLVVSNGDGSVTVYAVYRPPTTGGKNADDAAGQPLPATPGLKLRASFGDCPGARSPVVPGDSSKAFVACTDADKVLALSLAAAPGSWAARQDPTLLTDHALALLHVGQRPTNLTAKPDGGEIFASNTASDSVSEISVSTVEVESTFAIGSHPGQAAVSADNSALWVANGGADSLSLYSIDDGSRLPFVRTGPSPDALAFSAGDKLLLAADRQSGDVAVVRTQGQSGPGLLTMLPAGREPVAIVIKAMQGKP